MYRLEEKMDRVAAPLESIDSRLGAC